MCLAIPAQITAVHADSRAVVNLDGVSKEISVALIDSPAIGDYVIVHVGYALTRLDEKLAKETLQLLAALNDQGNH